MFNFEVRDGENPSRVITAQTAHQAACLFVQAVHGKPPCPTMTVWVSLAGLEAAFCVETHIELRARAVPGLVP